MTASFDRLPYPGLRAFERDEADLFFGRDAAVNDLVLRLSKTRFLSVLGASGTGKSSLVRTGMLDGLELGLHPVGANWRFCDMAPGGHPIRNLARGLMQLAADEDGSGPVTEEDIEGLEWFLRRGPRGLIEWLDEGHLPKDAELLVLVDQFEELFRFVDYEGREVSEAFVKLLIHASQEEGGRIHVVLTMRSEYLGACVLIPGLAETINRGSYLTPRMGRDSCRMAIEGPARMYGADINPALVNQLLNDLDRFAPFEDDGGEDQLQQLSRRADQLPVMQHVLNRVWQEEAKAGQAGPLRLETYRALGGITGALNQHGGEILASLGADAAKATEKVFRALVGGATVASTGRRALSFANLVRETGLEEPQARQIVDAFRSVEVNFLRPPSDVALIPSTIIDISHESLIRQWSRLSEWLLNEAQGAAVIKRISDSMNRHEAGEGDLLAGLELSNIVNWWREDQPTAEWVERYAENFEDIQSYLKLAQDTETKAQEERRRHLSRERRRLYLFAGFTSTIAVVAGLFFLDARVQQSKAVASKISMLEATESLAIGLVERLEKDRTIPLGAKYGLIQNTEDAFRTIANDRADDVELIGQRADFLLSSVVALSRGDYWAEAASYAKRLEALLKGRPEGWTPDIDFEIRSATALADYHRDASRLQQAERWLAMAREKLSLADDEAPTFLTYTAGVLNVDMRLAAQSYLYERALNRAAEAFELFEAKSAGLKGQASAMFQAQYPEAHRLNRLALADLAIAVIKMQRRASGSITRIDAHLRFGVDFSDIEARASAALDYLRTVDGLPEPVLSEAKWAYQAIRGQKENQNDSATPAAVYEISLAVNLAEDLSAADPSNRHFRTMLLQTLMLRGDFAMDADQNPQAQADLDAALDLFLDLRLNRLSQTDRSTLEPWLFFYRRQLAAKRGTNYNDAEHWERKRLAQSVANIVALPDQSKGIKAHLPGILAYVDMHMLNRSLVSFDEIRESVDDAMTAMAPTRFDESEPYFWLVQRQYLHHQLIRMGPDKLGPEGWSNALQAGFAEAKQMLELAPGSHRSISSQMTFLWIAAEARHKARDFPGAIALYRQAFDMALVGTKQDILRQSEVNHLVDSCVKLLRNLAMNGPQYFDAADLKRVTKLLTGELTRPRSTAAIKLSKTQFDALQNEMTALAKTLQEKGSPEDLRLAANIPDVVAKIGETVIQALGENARPKGDEADNLADINAVRVQLGALEIDSDLQEQGAVYWVRPPFLAGLWRTIEGADFDAMKARLEPTGFADQISYIRSSKLPFYDNVRLIEIQLGTGPRARLIAYLVKGDELYRLNGTSSPIHDVNAKAPIRLENTKQVAAYLRFFHPVRKR